MEDFKLSEHRAEVDRLITYIPWLESKVGAQVSSTYSDNGIGQTSIAFPVYDAMLLNFVNEASKTGLMNKNYVYAYSSYGIRTIEDEKKAIMNAGVTDSVVLVGILSKYVLGGVTKGRVWTTAVTEGIFLLILKQMKKILEIWDRPLA